MINNLLKLFVPAVAIMFAGYLLDEVTVQSFGIAIVVSIVLGLLNMTIKPILQILTIPVTILTLGLFLIVIDAILVIFTSKIIEGFQVDNLFWAIIFSLFVSVTSTVLNYFLD
ncbi:MAG: phage holin family protein [Chitinophagales bacterium]